MKKLLIFLSIIVVLFAALFVINQQANKTKYAKYENNVYGIAPQDLHPETLKLLDDPNYQNIILPDELQTRIDNKESFFVYYFASTCPHCKRTTPILAPMAKEMGIDVKQFNLEEFPDAWDKNNIQYTPTLVYYKDGVEAERIEGGIAASGEAGHSQDTYKQFLEKHNAK